MKARNVRISGAGFVTCMLLGVMLNLTGCGPGGQSSVSAEQTDHLYQVYLDGNIGTARHTLHELVRVSEKLKSAHGQAYCLRLTYARLYALEARCGNSDAAAIYLLKSVF
jgi:hypothetical protein